MFDESRIEDLTTDVQPATAVDGTEVPRRKRYPAWRTIFARLVDWVVVVFAGLGLNVVITSPFDLTPLLAIAYVTTVLLAHGRTVGMRLFKLELLAEGCSELSATQILARAAAAAFAVLNFSDSLDPWVSMTLSGLLLVLGIADFVLFLIHPQRRSIFEFLTRTLLQDEAYPVPKFEGVSAAWD